MKKRDRFTLAGQCLKQAFGRGNHDACRQAVSGSIANDKAELTIVMGVEIIVVATNFSCRLHGHGNVQAGDARTNTGKHGQL